MMAFRLGAFFALEIATNMASCCNRDGLADNTKAAAHWRQANAYKPDKGNWDSFFAILIAHDGHLSGLSKGFSKSFDRN